MYFYYFFKNIYKIYTYIMAILIYLFKYKIQFYFIEIKSDYNHRYKLLVYHVNKIK